MNVTKQDKIMNEIIRSVTHGEKQSGDTVLSKDYDICKGQMGAVFRTLTDNGIVEQTRLNSYVLTDDCVANAQEMYFGKIRETIVQIKMLAEAANISLDVLIDVMKGDINV